MRQLVQASLLALALPGLSFSASATGEIATISLEPRPLVRVAPELGQWLAEDRGVLRSKAHPLAPSARLDDGLHVSVELRGAGPLGMSPVALAVGGRELPPGPSKLSRLGEHGLRASETWLGVDEELFLEEGALKHDLLVSRAALETLGPGDLRASWRLELPEGSEAKLEARAGLVVRDRDGAFLARVPEPVVADAGQGHASPQPARLEWDGAVLNVVVEASWLASSERVFPLRIDPTVTLFPSNNARTGWVDELGNRSEGAIDSGSLATHGFGFEVRGFAEFDTSPIPDSATILDTVLEVWLSNHDNPGDPAVPLFMEVKEVNVRASASTSQLHEAIGPLGSGVIYASEDVPRTGSEFCPEAYVQRQYDLGPLADATLKSRILADWFTVGFASEIVTDQFFDHIDYIGYPESVANPACLIQSFPNTRIRLHVTYTDDLPPDCDPGGPYVGGCPDRPLRLDGSGSSDPEGEPLTYSWQTTCPGSIAEPDQPITTLLLDEECSVSCSVTLTVSDGVNESSCTESVSLADELDPLLNDVPEDQSAPCDDLPPVGMPSAMDDCDPEPEVLFLGETRRAGPCPDSYTLIRRWQALDRCGRRSPIESQSVSVSDDEPPQLADVPPDESVSCSDVPPPAQPTASDDCDPSPEVEYLGEIREDGPCEDSYTLRRRWQALDRCGNVSEIGEQVLTVTDDVAPVISGLPAVDERACDEAVPGRRIGATDDCDPDPVLERLDTIREDGPCEDSYTLRHQYLARDRCGNESEVVEWTEIVTDDEAPILDGVPGNETVSCLDVPPPATPTATDDCDPAPVVDFLGETREDGPCEDSYTLRRRWEARDRCGNVSAVGEQLITVVDDLPPSLEGVPADAEVGCNDIPDVATPTASDDCDPAPFVEYLGETREDGSCQDSYLLRRRWEARDGCGNVSSVEEQVITVTDVVPPTLLGVPPDAEVSCDAVPPVASPTATDDCDPAPRVDDLGEIREDGPCPDSYTLRRRWEAVDRCANVSAVEEQVITVTDSLAPELLGVPADVSVSCDAIPPVVMPTATDDCDPAPTVDYLGESREDGPCPDTYTLRRQWQAVDRCGNVSSVEEQVIEVSDSEPPALLGVPADATVECDAVPPPPAVSASDTCDPMPGTSFRETRVDGSCPGEYTLTRTWTATDRCGNSSSASQVLSVVDTTPPVVVPPAGGTLACLWPPNHRYVCFDLSELEVEASDACSEPVTIELAGCESNQPDNAPKSDRTSDYGGDGNTVADCIVMDGGSRVCVRSERAGAGPDAQDGRRYSLQVVAVDACGNRSEPVSIGDVHVPHDQSPSEDCIDSTKEGVKDKDLER